MTRAENGPMHGPDDNRARPKKPHPGFQIAFQKLRLTEIQTRLVSGTFPFNFQIDVYFEGNLIHVALNHVQQTPLTDSNRGPRFWSDARNLLDQDSALSFLVFLGGQRERIQAVGGRRERGRRGHRPWLCPRNSDAHMNGA